MGASNASWGRDWQHTLGRGKRGGEQLALGKKRAANDDGEHQVVEEDADIAWALERWDEPSVVVIVDTETTGTHRDARIVELSAAKVELPSGRILDLRSQLCHPGRDPYTGKPVWIPPDLVAIHGITNRMVAGKPEIGEVLPKFIAWLQRDGRVPLVAHNAPFDLRMMHDQMGRTGSAWPRLAAYCSLKLARRVLKGTYDGSCALGTLAEYFGVEITGRHRGAPDVRTTAGVVSALLHRAHRTLAEIHGDPYEF